MFPNKVNDVAFSTLGIGPTTSRKLWRIVQKTMDLEY